MPSAYELRTESRVFKEERFDTIMWLNVGLRKADREFVFEYHTNDNVESRRKLTVLVIDDSADIALMLTTILQNAGYEAVMSTSAVEALKLADNRNFDLVISDIAMPEMDGYSLARALRSRPEYREVPLIAVTGFDQYDDRERALAAGFNTHVKKPVEPTHFIELVSNIT
jgi:CheY-like chemotaxis protein